MYSQVRDASKNKRQGHEAPVQTMGNVFVTTLRSTNEPKQLVPYHFDTKNCVPSVTMSSTNAGA